MVGMLLGMGVLMVHSASMTSHPSQHAQIYLSRHLIFLVLGVAEIRVAALAGAVRDDDPHASVEGAEQALGISERLSVVCFDRALVPSVGDERQVQVDHGLVEGIAQRR